MGVETTGKRCRRAWMAILTLAGCLLAVSSGLANRISISQGAACEGLDEVACCAQTAAVYAFRATGDQLSKQAKLVVDLSCNAEKRHLPKHACRQLLIARGLSPVAATNTCEAKGIAGSCAKQEGCKDCVSDMAKLGFRDAQGLCYAATWTEPRVRGHRR